MPLSRLYQSRILELNRAPLNYGDLKDATHNARGVDALCGDDLEIQLIVDAGGMITVAKWNGQACAVTGASASLLTEWLAGKNRSALEEGLERFKSILSDDNADESECLGEITILAAVGRFPSRVKNALLPWSTALEALHLRN